MQIAEYSMNRAMAQMLNSRPGKTWTVSVNSISVYEGPLKGAQRIYERASAYVQ